MLLAYHLYQSLSEMVVLDLLEIVIVEVVMEELHHLVHIALQVVVLDLPLGESVVMVV